jgi:hypothetical protein
MDEANDDTDDNSKKENKQREDGSGSNKEISKASWNLKILIQ